MRRSTDHILTTHTGSLQRPKDLLSLLVAQQEGAPVDTAALTKAADEAVDAIVRRQAEAGLSVVNDGEMNKASYATYIKDRLIGLDGPENPRPLYGSTPDVEAFPEWGARWLSSGKYAIARPVCNGPISHKGTAAIEADIARVKAAAARLPIEELFMTAISPASVANNHPNEYYKTQEEYLYAIADALHFEYKAITDAGLVLQIDCVDLGGRKPPGMSTEDVRKDRAQKIELINHATKGLPAERIRIHVCWGALEGPHHHDAPLEDFADILLGAHPQGLMLTAANGRHEHEWRVWQDVKVPEGKVLIPGVIDNTTNIIEHPRVVADRLIRFAEVVGRENVIGGVDCGFSSNINIDEVDREIAFLKLKALADGAAIASAELWRK
jgi:5-methyltetrahydropteroyltriglutamate--homocysteine methyltransferase